MNFLESFLVYLLHNPIIYIYINFKKKVEKTFYNNNNDVINNNNEK